jgi:hypothetical protein
VTIQALVRYGAVSGVAAIATAIVVWTIAVVAGYPELAPWADLIIAGSALVFAASLFTGTYLGRPHVTYLDDNYSPLISGAGCLRLVLFGVALIVAAFITTAAIS